jgi:hypothetical protein
MSVKEFLQQRAVNISVGGHYTLANWFDSQGNPRTFACRTSRVSPFRMLVAVPVVGKVGDRVTQPKREKLSSKLTWLEKKQKNPGIPDGRRHVRIIPANPHSTLTFADGSTRSCFIIDMSMSGASVSSDVQPQIGMPLAVGACVGRVVRLLPDGFAVKFVERQNRDDLERRVVRPAPLSAGGAKAMSFRGHFRIADGKAGDCDPGMLDL